MELKKLGIKNLLLAAVICIILAFGSCLQTTFLSHKAYASPPSSVVGNVVWGNMKSETWSGRTFTYMAGADVSSSLGVSPLAYIKASEVVPPDNIGVRPELYNSAGMLVVSIGATYFNSYSTDEFWAGLKYVKSLGQSYYAAGSTVGMGNSYYHYFYCSYTPLVSLNDDSNIETKMYDVNGQGLTFGSLLSSEYMGVAPDLVSVVATNGTEGYIYFEDMEATDSAQVAQLISSDIDSYSYSVPTRTATVYANDGLTVVGEFEFGGEMVSSAPIS